MQAGEQLILGLHGKKGEGGKGVEFLTCCSLQDAMLFLRRELQNPQAREGGRRQTDQTCVTVHLKADAMCMCAFTQVMNADNRKHSQIEPMCSYVCHQKTHFLCHI